MSSIKHDPLFSIDNTEVSVFDKGTILMEYLVVAFPFLSSIHSVAKDVCRQKTLIFDD